MGTNAQGIPQYSYSPTAMSMLWEIIKMPDGTALLMFDNKTYEVTVKQLAPKD